MERKVKISRIWYLPRKKSEAEKPRSSFFDWFIRELRTSFTTEDTENAQRNTEFQTRKARKNADLATCFLKFISSLFRAFRKIRVRKIFLSFQCVSAFSLCSQW